MSNCPKNLDDFFSDNLTFFHCPNVRVRMSVVRISEKKDVSECPKKKICPNVRVRLSEKQYLFEWPLFEYPKKFWCLMTPLFDDTTNRWTSTFGTICF